MFCKLESRLGHLKILVQQPGADGAQPEPQATFRAWDEGVDVQAGLFVTKSLDGKRFFFWFDGKVPGVEEEKGAPAESEE